MFGKVSIKLPSFTYQVKNTGTIIQIGNALEQSTQGRGGVSIPGGVRETWRCGTEGLSGHGGDVSWLG